MKTVALLRLVDEELIAGYERKHPEAGSLAEACKQAVNVERQIKRRWELMSFGFKADIIATIFLGVFVTVYAPYGGFYFLGEWVCLMALAMFLANHKQTKLLNLHASVVDDLFEFEDALKEIYPWADQERKQSCTVSYVHERLLTQAVKILRMQKRSGSLAGRTIASPSSEQALKDSLDRALKTAAEEFDLRVDKRKLFGDAQKWLDRNPA